MKRSEIVAIVLVAVWVAGSFAVAVSFGNSHLFQRAGAALLVVGAAMIYWQLRVEQSIDRRLDAAHKLQATSSQDPTERLAVEVARARGDRWVADAFAARIKYIGYLAAITAVGEAIHGFGDVPVELVMCYSGSRCF